jgi:hypothetical protein
VGPYLQPPEIINDTSLTYDWVNTASYNTIHYTVSLAAGINVNYDNILNLSGPGMLLDQYGLYFMATNGNVINLYVNPENVSSFIHYGYRGGSYSVENEDAGPISLTPTPEPSTWLLMGSGLFALAGLAWKSRRAGLEQHT